MKDFAKKVIGFLKSKKVDYGDVRVVKNKEETLRVKNEKTETAFSEESLGFGVRVIVNGAWGFASSSRLTKREIESVVKNAIEIAKGSSLAKKADVRLTKEKIYVDTYKTPYKMDPFSISLKEKIGLLLSISEKMKKFKEISLRESNLRFYSDKKVFANTEGSLITQDIMESGGGFQATAIKGNDIQVRSYPTSFGGNFATCGYELIEEMKLLEHVEPTCEECIKLLSAKPCPSIDKATIIIDTDQLALQIHESIGHAVELDRVMGMEESYAGTSFVTIDKLNNFKYGSKIVNVYADATIPRGLGTFGYDDEGIKARRVPVIQNGIFKGYLSSRETASKIRRRSSGAMRADGWNRIPLVRMTNVNLEAGKWTLEALIRDTDNGILFKTNRSWSIDQRRVNFQFGTEIAYRIRKGKIKEIYKNPTYTGITPIFWSSCDAICDKSHWRLWGIPNCGKGEPGQTAHVGHGAAPARFRNVRVGLI
ncbi:TldD/PmbA family protein [candidate division WOR-3 bacterium]|nr:TldD/PmbA family protein [candidate division WOR-3 bacterium]